jgi:hypothetical protein
MLTQIRALRETAVPLWHCTDVLPGPYCSDLDLPTGSSYAEAAWQIDEWCCQLEHKSVDAT